VRAVWPERFIFDGEARVRGVIDPAPVTDDSEHETSGMIVYVAETGTETTPYVVNTEEDMRDNYAELVADGLAKDTDDGFRAYLDSWMSVKMPVEIWNTDGEQEWIAARV
jgi:acetaldehyde dehydrogenase (acetylating)